MFSAVIKAFLNSVISERRKLNESGQSRINVMNANMICDQIYKYINAYNYSDHQAAAFFIRSADNIRFILPGPGSKNYQPRIDKFIRLYSISNEMIKAMDMEKFSYYRLTNESGEALIKTSHKRCIIIKKFFDGRTGLDKYDVPYKRQHDDIIVEIDVKIWEAEFHAAIKSLNSVAI